MVSAQISGAAVGQLIAVDAGDDDVLEVHAARRLADAAGLVGSTSVGRPVAIWQNPQERVQTSPRIIRVAVPAAQHSPMLGHLADWQTVCRLWLVDHGLHVLVAGPAGQLARSQSGLRRRMKSAWPLSSTRSVREILTTARVYRLWAGDQFLAGWWWARGW